MVDNRRRSFPLHPWHMDCIESFRCTVERMIPKFWYLSCLFWSAKWIVLYCLCLASQSPTLKFSTQAEVNSALRHTNRRSCLSAFRRHYRTLWNVSWSCLRCWLRRRQFRMNFYLRWLRRRADGCGKVWERHPLWRKGRVVLLCLRIFPRSIATRVVSFDRFRCWAFWDHI